MAYLVSVFLVYSLIGFVLETAFALLTRRKLENRKTLLMLPMCPVYGAGAVTLLYTLEVVSFSPMLVFSGGMIAGTVVEYVYGSLSESLLGVTLWDYSAEKGNCRGLICLPFTLMWGGLSLLLLYVVQPALMPLFAHIPPTVSYAAAAMFCVDAAATALVMKRFGRGKLDTMPGCPVMQRKQAVTPSPAPSQPLLHTQNDSLTRDTRI